MANPLATKVAAAGAAAVLAAAGLGLAAYEHPSAGSVAQAAAVATTTTSTGSAHAKAAHASALKTVLDQLVGQGKISQTQEGEITSALQQYRQAHPARPGAGAFGRSFLSAEQQAVATALKLTPQQLRQQLQSGKSIDDIAAAQHVDSATVQQAVLNQAKARLDAAVKSGKLTQQREDKALAALKARLPQLFAAKGGQFAGHPGRGGRPAPATPPQA